MKIRVDLSSASSNDRYVSSSFASRVTGRAHAAHLEGAELGMLPRGATDRLLDRDAALPDADAVAFCAERGSNGSKTFWVAPSRTLSPAWRRLRPDVPYASSCLPPSGRP